MAPLTYGKRTRGVSRNSDEPKHIPVHGGQRRDARKDGPFSASTRLPTPPEPPTGRLVYEDVKGLAAPSAA